jgi:hypothetical protein
LIRLPQVGAVISSTGDAEKRGGVGYTADACTDKVNIARLLTTYWYITSIANCVFITIES